MREYAGVPQWESMPSCVEFAKHYANGTDLVLCTHGATSQVTRPNGTLACSVCHGDEFTTSNFTRPVRMLVRLTAEARKPTQVALF